MLELLGVVGLLVLATGIATLVLRRLRPGWPRRRVSMVAAAILPAIGLGFALYVGISVWLTPDDKCGVDACGMAMVGVVMLGMVSVGAFIVCTLLADALQSVLNRR